MHHGPRTLKLGKWCPGADSNHRHADFQSAALPTELPGQIADPVWMGFSEERDPSLVDIAAHKATVQPEFNEKRQLQQAPPKMHRRCQPHAIRTGSTPLLAIWGWIGDIGAESYKIRADPTSALAMTLVWVWHRQFT